MADLDFIVAMVDDVTKPAREVTRGIEAVAKASNSTVKDVKKLAKGDEELTKSLKEIGKQAEAADAIEAFGRSLKTTAKAADKAEGGIEGATGEVKEFGKSLGKTAKAADKAEDGIEGATGGLKGFGKSVAAIAIGSLIADIGLKLVGALFDAAKAFGRAALKGAEFGRTTKNILTAIASGDAAKGAEDFEAILEVAKLTKAPLEEVREGFVRLRQAGLSTQEAIDFTTIRQDIQAAGGEGDIFLDKMRDLAKEGQVTATIFEDVAEQLGGKEILGKELGLFGLQLDNTEAGVEALDLALKQLDPEVFKDAAVRVAEARGEIGSLSAGAREAGDVFDSIAEVSFAEIFKDFDLGKLFGPLLSLVQPALDAIIPLITELVEGFGEGLGEVLPIIEENLKFIGDLFGEVTGEGTGFKDVIRGVGRALGVVIGIIGAALAGIAALIAIVVAVKVAFNNFANSVLELGKNIVSSLVNGIKNAGPAAVGALKDVVNSAVNAAKSALGIASPSKVFEELGEFSAEGFAQGIAGQAGNVQGVSAGALSPGPAVTAAAGGVGGGVNVESTIVVQGAGDAAEVAAMVKTVFLSEVGDAVAQIASEVGA